MTTALDAKGSSAVTTEPDTAPARRTHAGESVTPSQMLLETSGGGWTYSIYGSNLKSPPTEIAGWGDPLTGELTAEGGRQVIDLNTSEPNRYFLIWITGIDSGAAEISEVSLLAD